MHYDRRGFLKLGAVGAFGGLHLGDVLRLRAASPAPGSTRVDPDSISVIHLSLDGGLSHLDTFDMKPAGTPKYRSAFREIATSLPELRVCEHLPRTAKLAHKFVTIRSMTHDVSAHGAARRLMLTGQALSPTINYPAIGAVVSKELGPRNELPPYVWMPEPRGNQEKAGFLGSKYDPFTTGNVNVDKYAVRDLDLPMGVDWSRMESRYSLLKVVDSKIRTWDTSDAFDALDSYYQRALDLMRSPLARKAFDLAAEPEALRDRYGRTAIGQGSLLARRLVEAGVRFVTVSRGGNAWDHHGDIFKNLGEDFLPELDNAFATLLEDLEQRGMLDTTLVLVTGEFGRTPEINVNTGRDHWPNCFSLAVAGAGIEGGQVWGRTDKDGMFVDEDPVHVPDFIATIYRKLGVDHTKEYISNIGRPVKLTDDGTPLEFLL